MKYPIAVNGDDARKAIDLLIEAMLNARVYWHATWYVERAIEAMGVSLDEVKKELAADGDAWEPGVAP